MDRRAFLRTAATGIAALALMKDDLSAEMYFPSKVDPKLFEGINRVKDQANKTGLEKKHAPVIKAPGEVKAEEPFVVEVSVGEILHDMGQAHWIEYVALNVGNEPAGRVDFQSRGYLKPRASFTVVLGKDLATAGKVTLVAYQRCNLHGYWEGSAEVKVTA